MCVCVFESCAFLASLTQLSAHVQSGGIPSPQDLDQSGLPDVDAVQRDFVAAAALQEEPKSARGKG